MLQPHGACRFEIDRVIDEILPGNGRAWWFGHGMRMSAVVAAVIAELPCGISIR